MKKLFAVLLVVLLVPAFALAQEVEPTIIKVNDTLDISVVLPDGYAMTETWYGDVLYAQMDPQSEDQPLMVLSLGYSEEYADRSIGDLSEEEMDALIAISITDFANPTYDIDETSEGTKLIVVDENSEYDEYAEIYTVYQGYFIGMLVESVGGEQLTEDNLNIAIQFLSDMQFVHAPEA